MATPEQVAGWDIDVRPDGRGLPPGKGGVLEGEDIYLQQCAVCHGEFGEGAGRYPVLVGGDGSLGTDDPVKTVGSYWPYAATLFDYIRRTMPFGAAQTLNPGQIYALSAFLLYMNEIVDEDFVADANTLPTVNMPNRQGFIPDERPDVPQAEPCMKNCLQAVKLVGWAQRLNITPGTTPSANTTARVEPERDRRHPGRVAFNHCKACHSLVEGEHKIGPSLYDVFGRKAGSLADFLNYSSAMQEVDIVWTEATLRAFLKAPAEYISGTNMPFSGIQSDEQLDDLIVFLKQLTVD
ncbi:MFS transporter [Candidatus Entotheonella serta]|nr:MFS transporter [Candidatus Entotheonella serta]